MNKYKLYILFVSWIFSIPYLLAQEQLSEVNLKKRADDLFDQENYAEALSLYSQLSSNFKNEPEYIYKLGACKLFIEPSKEDALKFILIAQSRLKNPPADMLYYLAKAYHANYRFSEAIKYYTQYQNTGRKRGKVPVEREIQMCKNGQKLLNQPTDLLVNEKKQVTLADFYKSYHLKGIKGKLVSVPEEFLSKKDKSLSHQPIMFTSPERNIIYFSSYGEDDKNGKDLYMIQKSVDGTYGIPKKIDGVLNTPMDEDYPFLSANEKTLYFSSNGHNSMGGYDIFKSTWNETQNSWNTPENLDFAISSVGEDFMYIVDSLEEHAVFASTRASSFENVHVYSIETKRLPLASSIIEGVFDGPGKENAKITVKNASKNIIVGEYTTDSTGKYAMALPSGQAYTFLVESNQSESIHSGQIDIPKQSEMVAFNQSIKLEKYSTGETLQIKNNFEEKKNINQEEWLALLLKNSASLEVNTERSSEVIQANEQLASSNNMAPSSLTPYEEEKIKWANIEAEDKLRQSLLLQQKAKEIRSDTAQRALYDKLISTSQGLTEQSSTLKNEAITLQKKQDPSSSSLEKLEKLEKQDFSDEELIENLFKADLEKNQQSIELSQKNIEILQSENETIQTEISLLDQKIEHAKKKDKPSLETQKNAFIEEKNENNKAIEQLQAKKARDESVKEVYQQSQDKANSLLESTQPIESTTENASALINNNLNNVGNTVIAQEISSSLSPTYNNSFQQKINALDSLQDTSKVDIARQKAVLYNNWIQSVNLDLTEKEKLIQSLSTSNSTDREQVMIQKQQLEIFRDQLKDSLQKYNPSIAKEVLSPTLNEDNSQKTQLNSMPSKEEIVASMEHFSENEIPLEQELINLDPSLKTSFTPHSIEQQLLQEKTNVEQIRYLKEQNQQEVNFLNQKISLLEGLISDTNSIESTLLSNQIKLESMKKLRDLKEERLSQMSQWEPKSLMTPTDSNSIASLPKLPDSPRKLEKTESNLLSESWNKELESLNTKNDELNAKKASLQSELSALEEKLKNTKSKKKTAEISQQINIKTNELSQVEEEQEIISDIAQGIEKNSTKEYKNIFDQPSSYDRTQEKKQTLNREIVDLSESIEKGNSILPAIKSKKEKQEATQNLAALTQQLENKKRNLNTLEQFENTVKEAQIQKYAQTLYASQIKKDTTLLTSKFKTQFEIDSLNKIPTYASFKETEAEYHELENQIIAINTEKEKGKKDISQNKRELDSLNALSKDPSIAQEEKEKNTQMAQVINLLIQAQEKRLDSLDQIKNSLELVQKEKLIKNALILNESSVSDRGLFFARLSSDEVPVIDTMNIVKQEMPNSTSDSSRKSDSTSQTSEEINNVEVVTEREEFIILKNTSSSAYNDGNPIPINIEPPSGVVFKVQVGAFKKPIPQDIFKGFAPISGETTDKGFTRYLVGNFKIYENADLAKQKIRELGYRDAFVVGYKDGIRISLQDTSRSNVLKSNVSPALSLKVKENESVNALLEPVVVKSSWQQIEGVFYTIQIGAYKNEPNAALFKNIQPIYTDKGSDNIVRYTTGLFMSYEQALMSKELMIDLGIKDAFVASYKNGKKQKVSDTSFDLNDKTYSISTSSVSQSNEYTITYSVQIGAFPEEKPLSEINYFVGVSREYPVMVSKDVKGIFIYMAGNYKTREEAEKTNKAIRAKYPIESVVIKTKNGIKIDDN